VAADVHAQDPLGLLAGLGRVVGSWMPPALPRPPICTCALTATVPPSSPATAAASSGDHATLPRGTATPWRANSSFA
jgi:hypothetical protein